MINKKSKPCMYSIAKAIKTAHGFDSVLVFGIYHDGNGDIDKCKHFDIQIGAAEITPGIAIEILDSTIDTLEHKKVNEIDIH